MPVLPIRMLCPVIAMEVLWPNFWRILDNFYSHAWLNTALFVQLFWPSCGLMSTPNIDILYLNGRCRHHPGTDFPFLGYAGNQIVLSWHIFRHFHYIVIQSVTKIQNTHLPFFQICVFFAHISGTNKKRYLHLFASLSKELSNEKKKIFQIHSQNQLILAKTLFCQKKVSYMKKPAILEKSKTFFHGSKV